MAMLDSEPSLQDSPLSVIGRAWWLVLFFGLISIGLGAIALFQPEGSVEVIAVLLAIWLIVSGLFSIFRAFSHGITGGMRALLIITGVISMILGFFALGGGEGNIFRAEWILAIFIGIAFLFQGFAALFNAVESAVGRGWNIFGGIVLLIAGVVVLAVPYRSLFALALIVGIWLIIIGIFAVVSSFSIKSATKDFA